MLVDRKIVGPIEDTVPTLLTGLKFSLPLSVTTLNGCTKVAGIPTRLCDP
jgi:hypothetical protein